MDTIELQFLEMGKQEPVDIAKRLATFLGQAQKSLDIAVYDLHVGSDARDIVLDALAAARKRGVNIRFLYDSDSEPDPSEPGNVERAEVTIEFIQALGYPAHPVIDPCCLMHHKYIVLDEGTKHAQVWTGSTNFTDHSWSLQENNIMILHSQEMAQSYAGDFEDLWVNRVMEGSGRDDAGRATLTYKGKPAPIQVHFAPGQGKWLDHEIAVRIEHAQKRVTLCTGVLTSGHILSALTEAQTHHVPIDGVYDRTQMEGVRYQWKQVPGNHWKIEAFFETLINYAHLVGKVTTPWRPDSTHDFMHNKIMVVDDTVITGSYNFSRNAETNAENVLFIESPALAADYRAYIKHLADRYKNDMRDKGRGAESD